MEFIYCKGSVQTAKLTKNYDQKTIEESHHYVVRTYSIVSSHVHMDCQTSASAGESFIHLASHNLHRACIYCNLDPAWVQLGSSLDPAWIQPGSSLDLAWLQLGSSLDPAWIQLGHNMDSCWMQLGSNLDPAWTQRGKPGFNLDPAWIQVGFTVIGSRLDPSWI